MNLLGFLLGLGYLALVVLLLAMIIVPFALLVAVW